MVNILLVEDDKNIANTISYYLQQEGFLIGTARTVKEGIEKIKENPYDVMLLDINLPDGTGYELYEEDISGREGLYRDTTGVRVHIVL